MDPSVIPINLRRLRARRDLSQTAVAEAAGISRPAYRAIEKGEAEPRMDTLMAIARALDVNLAELVAPARPLKQVRFRARKRMKSRADVLADVARWLDAYRELEDMLGERRRSPLLRPGCSREPIAAAAWARQRLRLKPRESIRDICGLLEEQGAIKVHAPIVASELFFGLSVGAASGGPAIAVNTWDRISVERWIFSAAHELGHLVLHLGEDTFDAEQEQEDEQQERQADLFASHFLMPAEVFADEWRESRGLSLIDRVFKIKKIFRVSYKTVLYRVHQEYDDPKVWPRFHASYKRRFGKSLPFKQEPEKLSASAFSSPAPVPRGAQEPEGLSPFYFVNDRLHRLVRQALEQERISLGRAAEILDCSLRDMRELAKSWA